MRPLWRSQVPLVIACERRERTNAATSSSVGAQQPALADGEHLVGEEAERARKAPCAELAAAEGRARSVGDVLDQRDPVRVAELASDGRPQPA